MYFLRRVFGLKTGSFIMHIITSCFLLLKENKFPNFSTEPKLVVSYLHNLKSSDESLKEQVLIQNYWILQLLIDPTDVIFIFYQLEKAKKKEAAFIVTFAKREQEIAELKVMISFAFAFQICWYVLVMFFWIMLLSRSQLRNFIFAELHGLYNLF